MCLKLILHYRIPRIFVFSAGTAHFSDANPPGSWQAAEGSAEAQP